ncbi:ribosome maturation factor RimM [Rudaea sp.]|uniref:ribosome maturation factor RimM n=1 Tax=Rudaea sp. TaxID=2136325 RepID=UPI0039E28C24
MVLGKIVGLYGVEGWVKLESYSEPRTQIFKYSPWFVGIADSAVEYANVKGRAQGKGIVAHLHGVDGRDAAGALIGAEIRIPRSALPKPKRGEYYWADLEGLGVFNLQGVAFGKVSHLFSTGANDVLVVRDGNRERLVPFVPDEFVKKVDVDGGRIVVDWDKDF